MALSHCCCRTTVQCQQNQFAAASTWWQISTKPVAQVNNTHVSPTMVIDNDISVYVSARLKFRQAVFGNRLTAFVNAKMAEIAVTILLPSMWMWFSWFPQRPVSRVCQTPQRRRSKQSKRFVCHRETARRYMIFINVVMQKSRQFVTLQMYKLLLHTFC